MSNLDLSLCRLSICATAMLLSACEGFHSSTGAPGLDTVASRSRTVPATASAFSGSYSGVTSSSGCGGSSGPFFFRGPGKSSFLGRSYESGLLQANRVCAWSGGATLLNSRHPNQEIFMALSEGRGNMQSPCDAAFTLPCMVARESSPTRRAVEL